MIVVHVCTYMGMLVCTCKSHWKVGGYQTHLLFHSVWTAGAVLAWLPSPSLQSPCTSTAQGPHVHVNMICMQIILHTVCTYTVRMCEPITVRTYDSVLLDVPVQLLSQWLSLSVHQ